MPKIARFGAADVVRTWPRFPPDADKYARGVVGVDTGSPRYPGAAVLSVLGALNTGAGFIRFDGPDEARAAILARAPSVTFGPGRVDAWVVGCGWDETDVAGNHQRWPRVADAGVPMVVDAGALSLAADGVPVGSLLTPHAGELARLLGVSRDAVEAEPAEHARRAAALFRTTVLLKGHDQFVATEDGRVTRPVGGSPWLARAGSGDVLAGIAGTLLAQLHDPELAGLLAASLQAQVSFTKRGPYPPDRLAEFLPSRIGEIVLVTG